MSCLRSWPCLMSGDLGIGGLLHWSLRTVGKRGEKANSITILALGAVAYFTERGIVLSRDWVIHRYQVRSQLNDLQLEVMHAEPNKRDKPCLCNRRFRKSDVVQTYPLEANNM